MAKKAKRNFVKGALILMIANLIVKIIGACFKIPLNWYIGDEGMGIFGKAYTIYTMLFTVATAGIPIAISKTVSETLVTNDKTHARNILRSALIVLGLIGFVCSAALYFGATWFSEKLGDPACADAIRLISPAVFLVSVLSAFRGYFQGHQDMTPTAISEVIEAVGKLLVGLILSVYLIKQSFKAGAEGAVAGVLFGVFAALITMLVMFIVRSKKEPKPGRLSLNEFSTITKNLLLIGVPIAIGSIVTSLTGVIDMATISTRLIDTGFSVDRARELYGAYSGKAVTLFNMPLTIIASIGMSIVPSIAASIKEGNKAEVSENSALAIRLVYLFIVPCSIGMMVLSGPVLELLFGENIAAAMLRSLAPAAIFCSLATISSSVLQAFGKVYLPVIHMLIGGVFKIGINYFFVNGIYHLVRFLQHSFAN